MKRQLLPILCFVFFLPWWTVLAAREGWSVPSTLIFPLILVFVGAVALGWLWQQWRRGESLRKKALEQQHCLQQVFDQAPWPILLIDQHLRIVAANPAADTLFDQAQLVGALFAETVPEAAADPLLRALHEETVNQADTSSMADDCTDGTSVRLLSVNGRRYGVWYGAHGPRPNEDASAPCLILAEESANRMKSEFIANINHEVRTPMNAIIGYTEMLFNSPLASREKRFVEIIHKSSMALVAIFNDIMELSKIDSGRLQIMASPVRLESLIGDIEELYRDQAKEKGLQLVCEIPGHLPGSFILDGIRLKQVLSNLVSNAIKFTGEGRVRLLVDGAPSATQSGCHDLRFTVEDTGMGIPPADQQKIFEVFRQREDTIAKRYGGIGLGLTLCSRLVAMMGGRIDLVSAPGEGSRFTVALKGIPPAEPISEEQPVAGPGEGDPGPKSLTILVVDDVDLIKDVFVDFFHGGPHRVVTANSGQEALNLARSERPDIIFMDLNLSDTDGRSVTGQIRQDPQLAATFVVVMTGEILEEPDYRPLFDDFLQKPFRLDTLRELIGRYACCEAGQEKHAGEKDQDQAVHDIDLVKSVQDGWSPELDQLLHQAIRSGSLSDATELGVALGRQGRARQDGILTTLGDDLLRFTTEPDIMGVDRQLALLARVMNRKEA